MKCDSPIEFFASYTFGHSSASKSRIRFSAGASSFWGEGLFCLVGLKVDFPESTSKAGLSLRFWSGPAIMARVGAPEVPGSTRS